MCRRKEREKMNREQADNLARLEQIADELRKVADLFNLAGYQASAEEVAQIDRIAQLAETCQKWARM